jgi:hypothetical protein
MSRKESATAAERVFQGIEILSDPFDKLDLLLGSGQQ